LKLENQRLIRFNFCPFGNAYCFTAGIHWLADSGLTTQRPIGRHTATRSPAKRHCLTQLQQALFSFHNAVVGISD